MLTYIIPFLILLTIVVFVHEYGHYYFARKYGVGVTTFSIGMGKELFGFTDKNGNNLSDDDIKKLMKSWTLQDFQDWFGFTHLDSYTGDSKWH